MSGPVYLVEPRLITGLALDIVKLMANGAPQAEDLQVAPILEHWSVGMPRAFGLTGYVTGHPEIIDGPVQTSQAMIIDADQGWVRTLSRYYLLRSEALP